MMLLLVALRAPNHSLERTRPRRREDLNGSWPGRSARGRWAERRGELQVWRCWL